MATAAQVHGTDAPETAPQLASSPGHEEIARLAYALWQDRGCPEGSPDEDWSQAETQLIMSRSEQGPMGVTDRTKP